MLEVAEGPLAAAGGEERVGRRADHRLADQPEGGVAQPVRGGAGAHRPPLPPPLRAAREQPQRQQQDGQRAAGDPGGRDQQLDHRARRAQVGQSQQVGGCRGQQPQRPGDQQDAAVAAGGALGQQEHPDAEDRDAHGDTGQHGGAARLRVGQGQPLIVHPQQSGQPAREDHHEQRGDSAGGLHGAVLGLDRAPHPIPEPWAGAGAEAEAGLAAGGGPAVWLLPRPLTHSVM